MKESVVAQNPQNFLSFGHDKNTVIVERIGEDLEARGHQVWIDKKDILFGDDWRERIVSGIMSLDSVLSFLSRHPIRKSLLDLNIEIFVPYYWKINRR